MLTGFSWPRALDLSFAPPSLLCVFSSSLTHSFGSHYVRVFILKSDYL